MTGISSKATKETSAFQLLQNTKSVSPKPAALFAMTQTCTKALQHIVVALFKIDPFKRSDAILDLDLVLSLAEIGDCAVAI